MVAITLTRSNVMPIGLSPLITFNLDRCLRNTLGSTNSMFPEKWSWGLQCNSGRSKKGHVIHVTSKSTDTIQVSFDMNPISQEHLTFCLIYHVRCCLPHHMACGILDASKGDHIGIGRDDHIALMAHSLSKGNVMNRRISAHRYHVIQ